MRKLLQLKLNSQIKPYWNNKFKNSIINQIGNWNFRFDRKDINKHDRKTKTLLSLHITRHPKYNINQLYLCRNIRVCGSFLFKRNEKIKDWTVIDKGNRCQFSIGKLCRFHYRIEKDDEISKNYNLLKSETGRTTKSYHNLSIGNRKQRL